MPRFPLALAAAALLPLAATAQVSGTAPAPPPSGGSPSAGVVSPPSTAAPATPPAAAPRGDLPPANPPVPIPERTKPKEPEKPLPRGAVLEEVSGTVRGVDRKTHRLELETPGGRVSLAMDRNTLVYTPSGLGTVLDLVPGLQVRAGRNADLLAYWIGIRATPKPAVPGSTPAQGTGPGGGAGGPAEQTGPGGGAPGTTPGGTVGPGSVSPGSAGGPGR